MHQITSIFRCFSPISLAILACALVTSACASTSKAKISAAPLTADEARAYEDGVDFIATLAGLEGRWRDDWDKDLSVRMASSDAVAIVTVKTVRTDSDPEHRVTHRLLATVDRVIFGDTRGKEMEFTVREGVPGFMSVNDGLSRIQGKSFVAYVKWYQAEGGRVAAHWHLSPASTEIVAETERAAAPRTGQGSSGDRVIVHNN